MADKKQCEEIVMLYKQGKVQFDIADMMDISYTTVSNIIKAYQEDNGKIKREKMQRKEYNIAEAFEWFKKLRKFIKETKEVTKS